MKRQGSHFLIFYQRHTPTRRITLVAETGESGGGTAGRALTRIDSIALSFEEWEPLLETCR
jgi:hypothetical protein